MQLSGATLEAPNILIFLSAGGLRSNSINFKGWKLIYNRRY